MSGKTGPQLAPWWVEKEPSEWPPSVKTMFQLLSEAAEKRLMKPPSVRLPPEEEIVTVCRETARHSLE
jgi:hypothetical protein